MAPHRLRLSPAPTPPRWLSGAAVLIRDQSAATVGSVRLQSRTTGIAKLIGIGGALSDFVSITRPASRQHQYAEWRKRLKDTFPNDDLSVTRLMGSPREVCKVLEGERVSRASSRAAHPQLKDRSPSDHLPDTHKCGQVRRGKLKAITSSSLVRRVEVARRSPPEKRDAMFSYLM
jgi:hypothetical protein